MAPTWDELVAKNLATADQPIRARVHHTVDLSKPWTSEEVWFNPAEQWRIHDAHGVPRLIRNAQHLFRRDESDVMERYDVSGRAERIVFDEPHLLVVAYRDFLESSSPVHEPSGDPEFTVVRGRAGWTVPCRSYRRAPHSVPSTLTFDAVTGVVIGRNVGEPHRPVVELSDLTVGDELRPAVFEWRGEFHDASADARTEKRTRDEHRVQVEAIPPSAPAYWPGGSVSAHIRGGDTETWALQSALQRDGSEVAEISRWPAGTHRPFAASGRIRYLYAWSDDVWDFEFASAEEISTGNLDHIAASIPFVSPPAGMQRAAATAVEQATSAARVPAAVELFNGPASISYKWWHFTTAPDYDVPSSAGNPYAGQVNGLLGTALAPMLEVRTGLHSGSVAVEIRLEPDRPVVGEEWEDIVEAPYFTDTPDVILSSFDGRIAELRIPLGHYRVRLSARGIDQADDTGEPVDSYQLLFWPDDTRRPDEIIKQTSSRARR